MYLNNWQVKTSALDHQLKTKPSNTDMPNPYLTNQTFFSNKNPDTSQEKV